MKALHKRLGYSDKDFETYILQNYGDGKSIDAIAEQLSAHRETLAKYFKKYGIRTRSHIEQHLINAKRCCLSDLEVDVLNGIMLADGHLSTSSISARLSYGCKYKETLADIRSSMPSLRFCNDWQDQSTKCWHFKSSFYLDLKQHHNKWYVDGKKIVPTDFRLTPTVGYWWFIGDGFQCDYGVVLCTESFAQKELLISKLIDVGFSSHVIPSSGRIRIESQSAMAFLEWAGSVGIAEQYKYKWDNKWRQRKK